MRPGDSPFDAQSTHQHVPILSSPVGGVSDVQYMGPVTEPLHTPPSAVAFQPQTTYYVTTLPGPRGDPNPSPNLLGLNGGDSTTVTTTAPWQPNHHPQYMPAMLDTTQHCLPVSRGHPVFSTALPPTKPEVALLLPVCMPGNGGSDAAGHVTGNSATLVTSPGPAAAVSAPISPSMNITNMEIVWHGKFNELFSTFPQFWVLKPTSSPIEHATVFNDSAKVRFLCKHCGNAWTSMKGRVIFWIQFNAEQQTGCVYFKLFGQQCQKCMPGTFEHSMWYPEEVVKVIENVYKRVGQLFYGFRAPVITVTRRTGRPRTQHNSKLCQACAFNICRQGGATSAPAPVIARA